jgi:hypothetical protein
MRRQPRAQRLRGAGGLLLQAAQGTASASASASACDVDVCQRGGPGARRVRVAELPRREQLHRAVPRDDRGEPVDVERQRARIIARSGRAAGLLEPGRRHDLERAERTDLAAVHLDRDAHALPVPLVQQLELQRHALAALEPRARCGQARGAARARAVHGEAEEGRGRRHELAPDRGARREDAVLHKPAHRVRRVRHRPEQLARHVHLVVLLHGLGLARREVELHAHAAHAVRRPSSPVH